jgi:hypothetical protein
MKFIRALWVLILVGAFAFLAGCKIVSFQAQDVYVTGTIDRTFEVSSAQSSYFTSQTVNLEEIFGDVDFAEVEEVILANIELTVIRNNMGPNTTASGVVAFNVPDNPLPSNVVLATFSNVNIQQVLNTPMTPYGALALLSINSNGVTQFHQAAAQSSRITFYVSGTVNSPPVDFEARLRVTVQLRLASS